MKGICFIDGDNTYTTLGICIIKGSYDNLVAFPPAKNRMIKMIGRKKMVLK